jgi:glycosyltransferase involved in cell wall biosynthesis
VIASRLGALPEIAGEERCLPPNDPHAVAARMRRLWCEPKLRRSEGDALIERARADHSEQAYIERLLDTYRRARRKPVTGPRGAERGLDRL